MKPIGSFLKIIDRCRAMISRRRDNDIELLPVQGHFLVEQIRDGVVIRSDKVKNTVMNTAVNTLWDTMFNAATQTGTAGWYMGLISDASYSAIAAADTSGSHAGWTEQTGYANATRPAWGPGSAASRQITNGTPVSFVASGSIVAKGLFIINQSTKGGTTGLLWCAGLFTGGDATLAASDELRVTYVLGA